MVKSRAAMPRRAKAQGTERRDDTQRISEMLGLAAAAKQIADTLGERFLAYLLAMVIQEMSHIESRRADRRGAEPRRDRATAEADNKGGT